eukprot:m.31934 g.31934  ORF g.31934 m.31934 type:complete len:248 (+) comp12108_c0_seq11:55-798(+)
MSKLERLSTNSTMDLSLLQDLDSSCGLDANSIMQPSPLDLIPSPTMLMNCLEPPASALSTATSIQSCVTLDQNAWFPSPEMESSDDMLIDPEVQALLNYEWDDVVPRSYGSESPSPTASALSNPTTTPTAELQTATDIPVLTRVASPSPRSQRLTPVAARKRACKGQGRYRQRLRASELSANKLEHQRKLARKAARRRRARWTEEQAKLSSAMAASEQRATQLKADHRQLQQQLGILTDIIRYRHQL